MGKFRLIKNSLLGGQISRDAVGRIDLPQYVHACELLQNMIPLLSGGAYRRPGTFFQDYLTADGSTPSAPGVSPDDQYVHRSSPPRVFPFITSNQLAYAVVIGTDRWTPFDSVNDPDGNPGGAYMRYYRASGNSQLALNYDIARGVLPYRCKSQGVAASATGQAVYTRQGGLGALANSGKETDGIINIIDVADSLQSYDDDVWSVQYCQSNDVMFLTHPDYPPQVIWLNAPDELQAAPYNHALFAANPLGLCQSRPYLNQNSTPATLSASWTGTSPPSNVGSLTSSVAFFDPLHGPRVGCRPQGESVSDGTLDGAIFALAVGEGNAMTGNNSDNGILFCRVINYRSSTIVDVHFINGVPSNYSKGTATTSWWESAWSNYRGWPKSCGIYQQRLCMAGTQHQPNALWFTATNSFGVAVSSLAGSAFTKFTALGDGPNQGLVAGAKGVLANGRDYATPANWVYYPVDDSQGDGQSTGPLGTQPFRISLATTSLDAIQYLSPDQQLFIGTSVQEWICAPVNGSFDVANSECTIQSHYGSDLVQAVRIGYEMIFVTQRKDEIRAYQYNYYDQSFFGEPVQLFFDEYPLDEENGGVTQANNYAGRRKFRQVDWDASRSTLWCIDTDGNFFGMTRDRKLGLTSWHTHQLGGFNAAHGQGQNITDGLSGGNYYTDSANFLCDGSVVSACTTPNPLSGTRDVWMVVKRSFQTGNQTVWSIERMVGGNTVRQSAYSVVAPGNAQEPLYVDCAVILTDNGDPTNYNYIWGYIPVVSNGQKMLAGKTLVGTYYSLAWGMFALEMQGVVGTNGEIALQTNLPPDYGTAAPHTIVVGLGYSSLIQPVRPDPPSPIGTSQGAMKRASKAYLRLFKTLMLKMGTPPANGNPAILERVQFAQPASLGQSPEIFTGDKEVFLPNTFDRDGYVYIVQDQPLPFTLVAVMLEGTEYEQ